MTDRPLGDLRVTLCSDPGAQRLERLSEAGASVAITDPARCFGSLDPRSDRAHVAEVSLGLHVSRVLAGDTHFVDLGACAREANPLSTLHVHRDRPFDVEQLGGARIGAVAYFQTTAVWLRAMHPALGEARWVEGPLWDDAEVVPRGLSGTSGQLGVDRCDTSLVDELARGGLDAVVIADPPAGGHSIPSDLVPVQERADAEPGSPGRPLAATVPMHVLLATSRAVAQHRDLFDAALRIGGWPSIDPELRTGFERHLSIERSTERSTPTHVGPPPE